MVYLICHAHAGNKQHWPGPDNDRPLSAAGGVLSGAAPPRWAKGSTWVLDSNDGRVVGARYLEPLRLKDLAGHH